MNLLLHLGQTFLCWGHEVQMNGTCVVLVVDHGVYDPCHVMVCHIWCDSVGLAFGWGTPRQNTESNLRSGPLF